MNKYCVRVVTAAHHGITSCCLCATEAESIKKVNDLKKEHYGADIHVYKLAEIHSPPQYSMMEVGDDDE